MGGAEWEPGEGATYRGRTGDLCAPASLTLSEETTTSVKLTWDAVDAASFYRISYQKLMPKANPTDPSVADGPSVEIMGTHAGPSYTVDGLDCGTLYEFRVQSGKASMQKGTAWGGTVTKNGETLTCPSISVTSDVTEVKEGENIELTIASKSAVPSDLDVNIQLTQVGSFVRGPVPGTVQIETGQTEAMLVLETDDDEMDEADGSVTLEILGPTDNITYKIGTPSSHEVTVRDNDPMLDAPTNLNVTPLPLRKARLTWTGDSNALAYVVEARDPTIIGSTPKTWNEWIFIGGIAQSDPNCCRLDIDLDDIVASRGLAHANSYELRVKATTPHPSMFEESDYSESVSIVDNPILNGGSANGYSPASGQAKLIWNEPTDVTRYCIVYRRLGERPRTFPLSDLNALRRKNSRPPWWPGRRDSG